MDLKDVAGVIVVFWGSSTFLRGSIVFASSFLGGIGAQDKYIVGLGTAFIGGTAAFAAAFWRGWI